ncbi:hypothetical protein VR46_37290, partial [Streptomyces sp. NRRL S-444]
MDYRKPDGAHLTLRVTRLVSDRPAARRGTLLAARRGTLLVVPGGPGGSGVDALAYTGPALRKALDGAYDLVSLDPRGVGGSTGVGCGLSADDRDVMNLRSWPAPGGDISDSVASVSYTHL